MSASGDVLIQQFDPQTGDYGWAVRDDSYDYHQEIARSAFADMLHDSERNEKYYEAIRIAINQKHSEGKKAHVLDIGTGTGLLAMMAAQCGADTIHACEAFLPISKCAEKVIEKNGFADRIKVIHKRSTDVTVKDSSELEPWDLPQRCNILVTEVFDTELIGEGAIGTFNHALTNLLENDCLVVPSSATVYAQVVQCDWLQRWNRLGRWGDMSPSQAVEHCPGAAAVHDLQLSQVRREDFKAITAPEPVFRFDWTGRSELSPPIPRNECTSVHTKALEHGTAQMVFMWWSLNMDAQGSVVLSCAPWWAHPSQPGGPQDIPWRDHWMQAVYYLPSPVPVTPGQTLKLLSSHDEYSLWFNLTTNDGSSIKDGLMKYLPKLSSQVQDTEETKRPVCQCMLHVTCSRTRIGLLNDPKRRDKYLQVLRRLVTPDSVVLSVGDISLLGLQAACLGAKKVYHIEKNFQSYEVMDQLIKDNNLGSKVDLVRANSYVDDELKTKISEKVDLVVGEPYFSSALYPWHLDNWWALKKQFPNAVGMPESASLYIMPMQFEHLHKIRAPLGTISGFKMAPFDELIQKSSSVSDCGIEVQPLWEYPGVSLGEPEAIQKLKQKENFVTMGNIPFTTSGQWNGVAMWVDFHLDADTSVSTGPQAPVVPGAPVQWDPYTRQAVTFVLPQVTVAPGDFMQFYAEFDSDKMEDVEFTFSLQTAKCL